MASFSFERLPVLDNLEIFSSEDESSYFPFHFHDVCCISLITKGVEQLIGQEKEAFATSGSISITNAGDVHRNQSALPQGYSYKTVYVSPDLLTHLNGGTPTRKFRQVLDDPFLYAELYRLIMAHGTSAPCWKEALSLLLKHQEDDEITHKEDRFRSIDALLAGYKEERLNINQLSRLFHLSPFHFIREFKRAKGITPQAYMMLKRLQQVKKDLSGSASLKDVAWSNGFYDASHLNYSFRRFFGTSAHAYQNSNSLH